MSGFNNSFIANYLGSPGPYDFSPMIPENLLFSPAAVNFYRQVSLYTIEKHFCVDEMTKLTKNCYFSNLKLMTYNSWLIENALRNCHSKETKAKTSYKDWNGTNNKYNYSKKINASRLVSQQLLVRKKIIVVLRLIFSFRKLLPTRNIPRFLPQKIRPRRLQPQKIRPRRLQPREPPRLQSQWLWHPSRLTWSPKPSRLPTS